MAQLQARHRAGGRSLSAAMVEALAATHELDGALAVSRLITAITLAELSVGPLVTADATERATRQARLQQAEADFDPLPFDAAAARAFGRVAASLRQARKAHARADDAMIAAIAISNDLPLYTCNPQDFAHMDGLDLRAVPHPDGAAS